MLLASFVSFVILVWGGAHLALPWRSASQWLRRLHGALNSLRMAVGSGALTAVLAVPTLGGACASRPINPSLPQASETGRAARLSSRRGGQAPKFTRGGGSADPFVRTFGSCCVAGHFAEQCGTGRPGRSVEVSSPTCGLEGRILLAVRGEEKIVRISNRASGSDVAGGKATDEHGSCDTAARNLAKRIALSAARPHWERTDGQPISEEPAYRGREFTSSGRLLGHPIDAELGFELRVLPPEPVEGVRVRVEIEELTVTAHRYHTSWGKVKTIEEQPVEVGYFPPQTLVETSGSTAGPCVFRSAHEMQGRIRPGRKDVVRLAGFAFGLACRYRIVVEGFGKGPGAVQLASHLRGSAPLPAEGGSSRPAKIALLTPAPSFVPR